MNITAIDTRVYNEMLDAFVHFTKEIRDLCSSARISQDWLDNQNVCQVLKISKRTLQYYRDSGKLGFSQVGNKCYYRNADIQALIDNSIT